MTDKMLVREALLEFISVRTPVGKYVAKRYGSHDKEFKDAKISSVTARVTQAAEILENLYQ